MAESHRRIRFVEILGQGGFGAVYLADVEGRSGFRQRLAVKILSADLSQRDDIAARQRDEARLLASLNHHAIVKVFDLITIEGRPAVLMEYVEGVNAAVLSSGGPLPPKVALQIIAAVADALHAAFTTLSPQTGQPLAVVHRDIKPANLLVSRHGGVKVLDFGIARAEFDREGVTGPVQYGSARYMAPEQWLYGVSDRAVDIYALAVSTIELLTGTVRERPPLVEGSFSAYVEDGLAALPAGIRQRDALVALLREMMDFHPSHRPDALTVSERMAALESAQDGDGLGRYARSRVPDLIAEQRARHAQRPLPGEISFHQEISQTTPPMIPRFAPTAPPRWILPVSALLGLVMMLGLVGLGLGLKVTLLPAAPTSELTAEPVAAPVEPAPAKPAPAGPAPAEPAPAEPAPAEPVIVVTIAEPEPVAEAAAVEAAVTEPAAEPEEAPAVATRQITFGSQKGFGTEVYLDGVLLGKTPLAPQAVPLGSHHLRMVRGEDSIETSITVGGTTVSHYTWKVPLDRIHGSD
jgi:serine/threonine protein kinase